jgi:cysteine dioxygenase
MEMDCPVDEQQQLHQLQKLTTADVPSIGSFEELIRQLRVAFETDVVDVDHVKTILSAYRSNPKDWKQYAKFDSHRYTRNLVDTGNGRYNMMLLCWGEGHGSSIHDHSDAHCFVKVLDGELKETMFSTPSAATGTSALSSDPDQAQTAGSAVEATEIGDDDGDRHHLRAMEETGINIYPKDGVTYINDSMGVHRVENASHISPAVSLHLYCPPFETCHTFDQRTGHVRTVRMTFWSKRGNRTSATDESANECSEIRPLSHRRPSPHILSKQQLHHQQQCKMSLCRGTAAMLIAGCYVCYRKLVR